MAFDSLTLGSFELMDWSGSNLGVSVIAEGTSRGAPVPIEVAVKTWIQDASVVITQGHENRTVPIRVRLRSPNLVALAEAEAALHAELEKPNLLTWRPGDAFTPATVFKVVTSGMEHSPSPDEDIAERSAYPWHTFNLKLTCEAFVQSEDEVVAPALAASGSTTTLVDNGSATTNWTGAVDGVSTSPTVSSGAVKVTSGSAVAGTHMVAAVRSASISTSATPYLVVDWKPESPSGSPDLRAFGDGVELAQAAQTVSPTAGYTRTWFGPIAAASIAVLRLESSSTTVSVPPVNAIRSLYVDNINRTDVKPTLGSTKQLLRSIEVAGSARTQGSIAIEHASSALGDVLAYFYPPSAEAPRYAPNWRQYRVSGAGATTDATMVSGAREVTSTTPIVFDVPVTDVPHSSGLLVVRGNPASSTAATFTWTAQLRINSTDVGSAVSGAATVTTVAGAYGIYALGHLEMPPVDVDPGSSAVVRVTLSGVGTGIPNTFTLDEAWFFSDIGRLVQVSCGTASPASGGAANRVFIEPATVDVPRPTVRIGYAADRSDSFHPATLSAWEFPEFRPPQVKVFTVTTNASDASVTLRYFPRWHTHAAM